MVHKNQRVSDDQPLYRIARLDAIIVTGTRRTDRTVAESPSPIDVFTPEDLVRQGTADTNQILQNLVPSFSVQRYAIADGFSLVRPPNLRGLPPDETLVLLNGKRRHRSALVQLGGGSLSEGSQAGFNYNKTTVTDRKQQTVAVETNVIIGDERVYNLQNILPKHRVVVTETWTLDPFSVLVRGNYCSSFAAQDGGLSQRFSGELVFDLEATYSFNEQVSLTVGAQNVFDNYPERDERGGIYPSTVGLFAGNIYPDFSPFGFNGGF